MRKATNQARIKYRLLNTGEVTCIKGYDRTMIGLRERFLSPIFMSILFGGRIEKHKGGIEKIKEEGEKIVRGK